MAKKNKKAQRASTYVSRADVVMPRDSGKSTTDIKAELESHRAGTQGTQRRLVARRDIHLAEKVFQWRGDRNRDRFSRENHIYNIARSLKDQGKPLDALLVLEAGTRFYVMDGHHRLAAYDTAGWSKAIPVRVFEGTLDEARLQAFAANVKDKLAMSRDAKSTAAWTIIKENIGALSAERVADLAQLSRRQAFKMQKVWRELNENPDNDKEQLAKLTWKQAHDKWQGKDVDQEAMDAEEWVLKKAEDLYKLMERHHVVLGLMDSEATAVALRMVSPDLPKALIQEWAGDYPDLIEGLAKQLTAPDEDF